MKKILSILIALTLVMGLMSSVAFAGTSSAGSMMIMRKPAAEPEPEEEATPEEATPVEATPAEPEEATAEEATPVEPEEATEEEAEEVVEETTPVEATEAEAEEVIEETTPAEAEEATADEAEEVVEETTPVEAEEEFADVVVRLEGDGMSEIIFSVNKGTEFTVLAFEGDWIVIDFNGQIGYIYKDSAEALGIELPETDAEVQPKVTIFTNRKSVMNPGDIITLTSVLEGLDGYTITYQWQVNTGSGWADVPGATGDSYSFEASVETLSYGWRLAVWAE